jgi:hypothetical protein
MRSQRDRPHLERLDHPGRRRLPADRQRGGPARHRSPQPGRPSRRLSAVARPRRRGGVRHHHVVRLLEQVRALPARTTRPPTCRRPGRCWPASRSARPTTRCCDPRAGQRGLACVATISSRPNRWQPAPRPAWLPAARADKGQWEPAGCSRRDQPPGLRSMRPSPGTDAGRGRPAAAKLVPLERQPPVADQARDAGVLCAAPHSVPGSQAKPRCSRPIFGAPTGSATTRMEELECPG